MTASPATLPGAEKSRRRTPGCSPGSTRSRSSPRRTASCGVDGSDEEWTRLTDELVEAGTLVRLNDEKRPNSFWARTDPTDVARVEERTYICSVDEADAGPTNNWMAPGRDEADDDRALPRLRCAAGRCTSSRSAWARSTAENPMFGVEITDSAYVVASMRIMTRMGTTVLEAMGDDADFVPALHSVGAPLPPGEADVAWPCNDDQVHLALPGDPGDLVVRVGLRRQLAARQEVLLAADRQRDGAATRAGSPSTC